jgi:hypothetical protein
VRHLAEAGARRRQEGDAVFLWRNLTGAAIVAAARALAARRIPKAAESKGPPREGGP